jgi:hypothetical protein
MRHSDQLDQLASSLAVVQASIEDAPKDKVNPHFKSKYADLATILQTVRPILAANGLSVTQTTGVTPEGAMVLTTTLLHKSGQWMSGDYLLEPAQRTPQGMGSAMTYGRRYALAAIVGIAQDDDDGNAASDRYNGHQQAPRYEQPAPRQATPAPRPAAPAASTDPFDKWAIAAGEKLGVNKYEVINHLAKHFKITGDLSQKWAAVKAMWLDPQDKLDLIEELRAYEAQSNANDVAELSTNA